MSSRDRLEGFHKGWNSALQKIKDKLSNHIKTDHGIIPQEDTHYVRWNRVESLIDELKHDEQR